MKFIGLSLLAAAMVAGCAGGASSSGGSGGNPIDRAAKTIDHTNYAACDTADAAPLAKAKLFFAHASVGGNIVSGLNSLHAQNATRYPLVTLSVGERPEGAVAGSVVCEYDRGNPGASAKITSFEGYVSGGWNAPTVNAVLNKFCFIDPDADFDQYTQSMERIAQSNPQVIAIYATIPLHTEDDDANVQRETFNERLRQFVKQKKRFLLDIADIEAYSPTGVLASFQQNGKTYRQLYSGYTTDGGHLNDDGSAAVAKGLISLLETAFSG